ncbi:heat shock transcription factor 1 [Nematocida sp. AWRm80]|nr:heat shock transcription factor 1 [Nematocida sp. AWRm80]
MSGVKFLKNLYSILSSDYHRSIEWNKEGNGLVILNKAEFIKHTLPILCKSDEYGTFLRQLSNYGFSKIKNQMVDEFVNNKFLRDDPASLDLLRRKHSTDKSIDVEKEVQVIQNNQQVLHSNMVSISNINRELLNEVYYLKDRVAQQDRTINELVKAFIRLFNKTDIKKEAFQLPDKEGHLKEIEHKEETNPQEDNNILFNLSSSPERYTNRQQPPIGIKNILGTSKIDSFLNKTNSREEKYPRGDLSENKHKEIESLLEDNDISLEEFLNTEYDPV